MHSDDKRFKRVLSKGENEIDEYFAELKSEALNTGHVSQPVQGKIGLSDIEEIRRLIASVARLREIVSGKPAISLHANQKHNSVKSLTGFTGEDWSVYCFRSYSPTSSAI